MKQYNVTSKRPCGAAYLGAAFEHFLGGDVETLFEEIHDAVIEEPIKLIWDHVEVVLHLKEHGDSLDSDEALIPEWVSTLRIKDAWCDDSGQIL